MEEDLASKRLIFISHSSQDTWIAKQIAREVSLSGATPFLDEADIEVGEDFEESILNFLEQAHELLVLLTPWALDRPYVWAEIGAAWGRRIPIVGILHGMTATEFQSRSGAPIFLKKRDLLDINNIELYFQQLKARTGEIVNESRDKQ
jgi:TIR domain-containing protein